eukprot:1910905-Prymnesium_polylepis.1
MALPWRRALRRGVDADVVQREECAQKHAVHEEREGEHGEAVLHLCGVLGAVAHDLVVHERHVRRFLRCTRDDRAETIGAQNVREACDSADRHNARIAWLPAP